MYVTVTNDLNNYYRAWSSGTTIIDGCTCIECDVLPNESNDIKKKYYKLIKTTTNETITYSWELDEISYNAYITELNNTPKVLTIEEKLTIAENKNLELQTNINNQNELVNSLIEMTIQATLPND